MGDARLSLKDAPESCYDMIILDAFSSDAIPIHLVTREAIRLYLAKLKPGGILVFHTSNRYLDLNPVLGNLARDAGFISLSGSDLKLSDEDLKKQKSPSTWVVMARTLADLGAWPGISGGTPYRPGPETRCGPMISPISCRYLTGVPSTWITG